jgi:nucleotide-binding universal stress UspA family protein
MGFHDLAVGVDLSSESELATMQAMGIARRAGARLVLIHVGIVPEPPTGLPESARATAEKYMHALQARAAEDRARVEALRQRLLGQGVELSHVFVEGFADAALTDTARELACDLIVVGTHGRTGARRFLLGSVAERTVRLASSSVLVARGEPHAADGGYKRIVVGTDFSDLADGAMARAVEVAADGAQVRLVHAWTVPSMIGPENAAVIADVRVVVADDVAQRSAELLRRYRSVYPRVSIEMDTSEAPPQEALVERAQALGADLIAVGSHGRRGVRRFVLGSVAEVTVRHAPCSVLIAR